MALDIDRVIDYVRGLERDRFFSPTMAQVVVTRLEFAPTEAELDRARAQVTGRAPQSA